MKRVFTFAVAAALGWGAAVAWGEDAKPPQAKGQINFGPGVTASGTMVIQTQVNGQPPHVQVVPLGGANSTFSLGTLVGSGGTVQVQTDSGTAPKGAPLLPGATQSFQFGPIGVTVGADAQIVGGTAAEGVETPNTKPSEYWIGVGVENAATMPALRAQLNLPNDQGLLVASVVPESPAAKAGLRENDVLVKANDKPLSTAHDLLKAVDAAKDKKLALEIIRGGKRSTVEVQPAKRPANVMPGMPMMPGGEVASETLRKLVEQLHGQAGQANWQFHVMQPGAILPPGAAVALPALPEDMTVVITKQGAAPGKIVVDKGKQHWELSENELDKLPADVRPHVEQMLHPLGRLQSYAIMRRREAHGPIVKEQAGGAPLEVVPPPPAPRGDSVEKRMNEMNQRLEEMQKAIDQLRARKPPANSPDKPSGTRL
jgi:membrane-associated protease RseP (regulator of RpoE activity)